MNRNEPAAVVYMYSFRKQRRHTFVGLERQIEDWNK